MRFHFVVRSSIVGIGIRISSGTQIWSEAEASWRREWEEDERFTKMMNHPSNNPYILREARHHELRHHELMLVGPYGKTTLRHDPEHSKYWTNRPGIENMLQDLAQMADDEWPMFDWWCEQGFITDEELTRLLMCFSPAMPQKEEEFCF